MAAMQRESTRVVFAALAGNLLIAVTKFVAAALTGSSAMLSEGVHSVVDTGNQALLLYGMRRARLPPDERFPFGHGKEIYFWNFVVALLIFSTGAGVSFYEGITHLRHPTPMERVGVAYTVLFLSLFFELLSWSVALRAFRAAKGAHGYIEAVHRGKDPTLFSVLFEDSAAVLGLLIAVIGVWLGHFTGEPRFDGAASVAIGVLLAVTAAWLAYETKSLLIGESANREIVQGIRAILAEDRSRCRVEQLLTVHMGPDFVLANISVTFAPDVTADAAEAAVADMNLRIKSRYPSVKRVFIEAQPRAPLAAGRAVP